MISIFVTNDFSKGAREEAERADATPVALRNDKQLVALMVESEIVVRRVTMQLIEIGEELNMEEDARR